MNRLGGGEVVREDDMEEKRKDIEERKRGELRRGKEVREELKEVGGGGGGRRGAGRERMGVVVENG